MPTMARIHYEIDDDLHRRVKAAAALRGDTLKKFIEDALRSELGKAETARKGRAR